ncbi:trehalose-phosphatase [Corynebacterium bovis]|uniref:trehalose-phosphatase n=1 Tax=Corynebacterium bovis TaxID=36808 RepID=UPI000F646661|nr:trehalose-phosphatase [Corynebacterium bovis]RRO96852.1 trehalose-phosphatase [Corynebacterium bovis]RRQ14981.1 trehalose-phosphatase [Corynebacterium bovis]
MPQRPASAFDSFTVSDEDIAYLAGVPSLLVACDFDGTLAEFTDEPNTARAVPGAMDALRDLAALPGTTVCVLSGRDLGQLQTVTELPALREPGEDDILLVGSHGAEPAVDGGVTLTDDQKSLLADLGAEAERQAARDEGMWVEYKTFAVGLHERTALDFSIAEEAMQAFHDVAAQREGTTITWGKDILEVAVDGTTKGSYVRHLREELGVDAVLFIGDDVTDETAMEVLDQGEDTEARPDMGVRVGFGATAAQRRVESPTDTAVLLRRLADARG